MIFGSVCSGIEAASVAWEPLGWKASFFSEIEKFPSAVLAHRWPEVPNLGDMTNFKEWQDAAINVLVGGTPCQSFSVAGLRKGLDDPRGNLMLTFGAIAAKYRPQWLVWENVPGVLSSNGGRDFGTFLGMLGQLGYGFAYRVLDAQYFGVAQRRRRVFVVGCLGNWRAAAAVLFERHSLSGNIAPRRETREEVAADARESATCSGSHWDSLKNPHPSLNQSHNTGGIGSSNQEIFSQRGSGIVQCYGIPGNWIGRKPENGGNAVEPMVEVAPCQTKADRHAVAHGFRMTAFGQYSDDQTGSSMKARDYKDATDLVCSPEPTKVRRLTPIEAERLQGFPDNHTRIPWRNKHTEDCPDGPRYKALGNSMAVPVMRWIGERIKLIDQIMKVEAA